MSNWPVLTGAPPRFVGADSPAGVSAVLTTSAAYTPSAWVEVVSSVPHGMQGVHLTVRCPAWRRCLVEFGIGAASSEVLIAQLPFLANSQYDSDTAANYHHPPIFVPLAIPSGVRLVARLRAPASGVIAHVSINLAPSSVLHPYGFARLQLYGLSESTLYPTTILAGGTSYGSWVQLVSSAPFRVRAVSLLGTTGHESGGANYGGRAEHQIGIGTAGSEVGVYARPVGVLYQDWPPALHGPVLPVNWPAGTRIAVRCRVDSGNLWEQSAALLLFG